MTPPELRDAPLDVETLESNGRHHDTNGVAAVNVGTANAVRAAVLPRTLPLPVNGKWDLDSLAERRSSVPVWMRDLQPNELDRLLGTLETLPAAGNGTSRNEVVRKEIEKLDAFWTNDAEKQAIIARMASDTPAIIAFMRAWKEKDKGEAEQELAIALSELQDAAEKQTVLPTVQRIFDSHFRAQGISPTDRSLLCIDANTGVVATGLRGSFGKISATEADEEAYIAMSVLHGKEMMTVQATLGHVMDTEGVVDGPFDAVHLNRAHNPSQPDELSDAEIDWILGQLKSHGIAIVTLNENEGEFPSRADLQKNVGTKVPQTGPVERAAALGRRGMGTRVVTSHFDLQADTPAGAIVLSNLATADLPQSVDGAKIDDYVQRIPIGKPLRLSYGHIVIYKNAVQAPVKAEAGAPAAQVAAAPTEEPGRTPQPPTLVVIADLVRVPSERWTPGWIVSFIKFVRDQTESEMNGTRLDNILRQVGVPREMYNEWKKKKAELTAQAANDRNVYTPPPPDEPLPRGPGPRPLHHPFMGSTPVRIPTPAPRGGLGNGFRSNGGAPAKPGGASARPAAPAAAKPVATPAVPTPTPLVAKPAAAPTPTPVTPKTATIDTSAIQHDVAIILAKMAALKEQQAAMREKFSQS